MTYQREDVVMNVPVKFTVLTCDNCNSKFVILYIMQTGGDDDVITLDYVIGGTSYYCPHCGKDHRKAS